MAWYDNGLQGDVAYPLSSGFTVVGSNEDVTHPVIVESFSADTGKTDGQTYEVILNRFSTGTVFGVKVTVTRHQVDWFSTMCPYVTVYMNHTFEFFLRNGDARITLGSNGINYLTDYYSGGDAPAGMAFSIYGFEYIRANGNPMQSPTFCMPYGGSDAGTNSSFLFIKNGDDIELYMAGYRCGPYSGGYYFTCPVRLCGRIRANVLNNPKWFDPNADAFTGSESGSGGAGEGGNIPDLPISPSYPGTDMTFPSLPTGANAFGFSRLTLYKPSASQLGDALDILYQDSTESTLETIIESCKKWWYKPDQYCISLMISPVDASVTNVKNIKFGKYDSEVASSYVDSQWQITDCGTIDVPLKYGSFLDFEPHAKCKLYLPYVGLRTINANEVIGGQIAIKYYTDMLTGASVCMVLVSRTGSNNTILYTFDCNLCVQVPLTAMSYSTVVQNLLSAGVAGITLGAGIATGGIAGAGAIFAGASGIGQSALSAVGSSGAPDLTQSGSLSANTGVLSYPKPYLCVEMPIPTTPSNYTTEKGRPSNIFMSIGRCAGFTVINNLHIDIPGITDTEIDMIRQAFRRGVYC